MARGLWSSVVQSSRLQPRSTAIFASAQQRLADAAAAALLRHEEIFHVDLGAEIRAGVEQGEGGEAEGLVVGLGEQDLDLALRSQHLRADIVGDSFQRRCLVAPIVDIAEVKQPRHHRLIGFGGEAATYP